MSVGVALLEHSLDDTVACNLNPVTSEKKRMIVAHHNHLLWAIRMKGNKNSEIANCVCRSKSVVHKLLPNVK